MATDDVGRRRSIRIKYPPHLAPMVEVDKVVYAVADLSVGGCMLVAKLPARYRVGQVVTGYLRFRDGTSLTVESYVLRAQDDAFALEFIKGIPPGYIERETVIFGGENRDRRRFFRLRYSYAANPVLRCGKREEYRITEISEAAIVFQCEDLERFMKGQQLNGNLAFHDGEVIPVSGYIFRMTADQIILLLSRFIPTARMMREQQYILLQNRRA